MTPLLPAGHALDLGCTPPPSRAQPPCPPPGAPDDPGPPRRPRARRWLHAASRPEPDHPSLAPEPPMTPLLAAATALGLGTARVPSTITLPCRRSAR
jgi:hypothetical protein